MQQHSSQSIDEIWHQNAIYSWNWDINMHSFSQILKEKKLMRGFRSWPYNQSLKCSSTSSRSPVVCWRQHGMIHLLLFFYIQRGTCMYWTTACSPKELLLSYTWIESLSSQYLTSDLVSLIFFFIFLRRVPVCSEVKLEATMVASLSLPETAELKDKLFGLLHNVILLKDAETDAYTPVSLWLLK